MNATEDFIRIIDNALPQQLCTEIIQIFDNSPNVQQGKTGGGVDKQKKDSQDISIQRHKEFSPIFQEVNKITSHFLVEYFKEFFFALIGPIALTLKDPSNGQPIALTAENYKEIGEHKLPELVNYVFRLGEINAQKYTKGQGGYPYWHSEIYPQPTSIEALHRNLLFMFYLNDVDKGGETEFYYQGKKIKPKAGRMVIAPAGFTHTHRGNKPISNDKYILTSWVLFNPAKLIFPGNKA